MDSILRELESASALDPAARFAYRRELFRTGRVAEAGIEPGDLTRFGTHLRRILERSPRRGRLHTQCIAHRYCFMEWINVGSKRLGTLERVGDVSLQRELTGSQSRKIHSFVAGCLEPTWCWGSSEEETRAYLKVCFPKSPQNAQNWLPNPDRRRNRYWIEAARLTNNWGKGWDETEAPDPPLPLFDPVSS